MEELNCGEKGQVNDKHLNSVSVIRKMWVNKGPWEHQGGGDPA